MNWTTKLCRAGRKLDKKHGRVWHYWFCFWVAHSNHKYYANWLRKKRSKSGTKQTKDIILPQSTDTDYRYGVRIKWGHSHKQLLVVHEIRETWGMSNFPSRSRCVVLLSKHNGQILRVKLLTKISSTFRPRATPPPLIAATLNLWNMTKGWGWPNVLGWKKKSK